MTVEYERKVHKKVITKLPSGFSGLFSFYNLITACGRDQLDITLQGKSTYRNDLVTCKTCLRAIKTKTRK